MSADYLFWGDATPSVFEVQREAARFAQQGDLLPALQLKDRGVAEEVLLGEMDKTARRFEKRLLLAAQAVELTSIYSRYTAVAMDENRATLHLLETTEQCNDATRKDQRTVCGKRCKQMFSVFRGTFASPPEGIALCSDCGSNKEALGEEEATIPGLDREKILRQTADRLGKRDNLSERTIVLATVATVVREGSALLAKQAERRGEDVLVDAWGEKVQQELASKSPGYKQRLGFAFWRHFFAKRSLKTLRADNTRADLFGALTVCGRR